tara:strand:- start:237 stop:815 length:579 start_codon:yes stop_codon:yes gene_type:complete
MISRNILDALLENETIQAKEFTETILLAKLSNALEEKYFDIAPSLFEKKAKVTDKEDDREGMDPVGSGDSDIDNDGDSDESDDYLKNRRKVISKKIKNEGLYEYDASDYAKRGGVTRGDVKRARKKDRPGSDVVVGHGVHDSSKEGRRAIAKAAVARKTAQWAKKASKERKKKELAHKRETLSKERKRVEKE